MEEANKTMTEPKYRAIMCDPPWGFFNKGTRAAAAKHYSTMSFDDILALPVNKLTSQDCALFLWSPNSFVKAAIQVMEAWGFRFVLPLTWVKTTAKIKLTGDSIGYRLQIGLGNYFRNCSEALLFGLKGSIKPCDRSIPTVFFAARGKHSAKPEVAYRLVERFTPGPYLDMFARTSRQGWDVWGDEVESDIGLANSEWFKRKQE